jgi:hypothetical protein
MEPIRPIGADDILLWPDGSWCLYSNLSEYPRAGLDDDYEVIPAYSARWCNIMEA